MDDQQYALMGLLQIVLKLSDKYEQQVMKANAWLSNDKSRSDAYFIKSSKIYNDLLIKYTNLYNSVNNPQGSSVTGPNNIFAPPNNIPPPKNAPAPNNIANARIMSDYCRDLFNKHGLTHGDRLGMIRWSASNLKSADRPNVNRCDKNMAYTPTGTGSNTNLGLNNNNIPNPQKIPQNCLDLFKKHLGTQNPDLIILNNWLALNRTHPDFNKLNNCAGQLNTAPKLIIKRKNHEIILTEYIDEFKKYMLEIIGKINNNDLVKCGVENFGLMSFKLAFGQDKNKLTLLVKYTHNLIDYKYVVKFFFAKNRGTKFVELDIFKRIAQHKRDCIHAEQLINDVTSLGTCSSNNVNYGYIKKLLTDNCGTAVNGPCAKKLVDDLLNYNEDINYAITEYAEFGTYTNILKENGRLKSDVSPYIHYINTKNFGILAIHMQIIWQVYKFATIGILKKDIHQENIYIYIDKNFSTQIDKYYKYSVGDLEYYIKVMPYIVKIADYGLDEIHNNNVTSLSGSAWSLRNLYAFVANSLLMVHINDNTPKINGDPFTLYMDGHIKSIKKSNSEQMAIDGYKNLMKTIIDTIGANDMITYTVPSVNPINILGGSNNIDYYAKYMKYKSKYIKSKK